MTGHPTALRISLRGALAALAALLAAACMPEAGTQSTATGSTATGSAAPRQAEEPAAMQLGHIPVVSISEADEVRLPDGLLIEGDARLARALRSGEDLTVIVLERFPPVFDVTFPDGASTRYKSRKAAD